MEKLTIFEAIPRVMADIDAVSKDRVNEQQRFKFRGVDDIYNAVHSVMARHGVFTTLKITDSHVDEVTSRQGTKGYYFRNRYIVTFYSSDGSSIDTEVFGEAIDYGDKATNKCASIAHKYALLQVFCIPTEDMDKDPDTQSHEIADRKRTMILNFAKIGVSEKKLEEICREDLDKSLSDNFVEKDYVHLIKVYTASLTLKKPKVNTTTKLLSLSERKSNTTN